MASIPCGQSRRQAPRHMWGGLQHTPHTLVSLPLPVILQDFSVFFKHGTWKMRSLFQMEKSFGPELKAALFLREKNSHLCSITERHGRHTCRSGRGARSWPPPAGHRSPSAGQGHVRERGAPSGRRSACPGVSQPLAENGRQNFKDSSSRSRQREKEQLSAPRRSSRKKGQRSAGCSPGSRCHGHGVTTQAERQHSHARRAVTRGSAAGSASWSRIAGWASPAGVRASERPAVYRPHQQGTWP